MPAPLVLALSYGAGTIPIANVVARRVSGLDLRRVGNGTVSGSALYRVAGFGPLALAGCVELAKGATGPLLAGRRRPVLGALATAVAITGHNWSPWLGWRGGRGLSLLLGSSLVAAPGGLVAVGASLGLGRLVRQSGVGGFVGLLALVAARDAAGVRARAARLIVVAPVLLKRLVGNETSLPQSWREALVRLLEDREPAVAGRPAR